MAASSLAFPRKDTKGWSAIPNSLLENQALLPHGELSLALVILRRGGEGVTISDSHWSAWTGLSPRLKEMAIKGLREKGLNVNGRGDDARFTWSAAAWTDYVRSAPSTEHKPRTAGRQVDPKPGAKVHPECRERGCSMLRAECASNGLTLVTSTPVAKPVSQTEPQKGLGAAVEQPNSSHTGLRTKGPVTEIKVKASPATQNAKPVSQKDTPEVWRETLSTLQKIFPLVTFVFLVQLLAKVRAALGSAANGLTDSELSRAVEFAYRGKSNVQRTEGLFFRTVPPAILAIRKLGAAGTGGPARPPIDLSADRIEAARESIAAALVERAPAASGLAGESMRRLYLETAAALRALDLLAPDALETFYALEAALVAGIVKGGLPVEGINQEVLNITRSYRERMTAEALAEFRAATFRRLVLESVRLPRFSL